MIELKVHVQGLDRLRANFQKAPALALKYLARATKASILEVEKNVTEGGIMQFKTPRSKRTGHLVGRWGSGGRRGFSSGGLMGFTGPSVHYAPYVYFGTRRIRPNKYMDRIARSAEPNAQKHFQQAVDTIVNNLAKI